MIKSHSFFITLLVGFGLAPMAHAMDSWAGRKLSAVVAELRAAGLPLIYSSQIVTDELRIETDPGSTLQLERLRLALQAHGLMLLTLQNDQGYAIVRDTRGARGADTPAATSALEEVTVFASRYNLMRDDTYRDNLQLPRATLEKFAGVEQDVLRSVQYLPGTSANGLSALTHVRGGYEDENLVRFDGVELYKPVHLKEFQGLFGMLDPDWVESLDFYSGAYPVRYGNHTASVLDIAPRVQADFPFVVGASLLYSRVMSTGSYDDAAGHWLLGYRRSNLQEVMGHLESRVGKTEFEDMLLRHRYRFAAGELRIGALRLNDEAGLRTGEGEQQSGARDHDSYLWLGWQQALTDTLNLNTQLTHTQLSSRRNAQLQRFSQVTGELSDTQHVRLYTLETMLDWQHGDTHWQLGARVNQGEADYRYRSNASYELPLRLTFNQPATLQRDYVQRISKTDQAAWLAVNQQWGSWRSEVGLRYERFDQVAHGTQFSPRVNLRYMLPAGSLHVSAGQYVQAQELDDLDTSVATPRFAAPQRMRQYIVGWTQSLSPVLQLRAEAYHKRGSRLLPQTENLLSIITLASELEMDRSTINAERSRAQGIELSLNAAYSRFGWWLNYSWSQVQDLVDGRYVPRRWDQPHAVTAGLNWTGVRWSLSGSASWHRGWTYTPLIISNDGSTATLGERNSQRFADFASVETRAQYTLPLRSSQLELFIELRNTLDNENNCCREVSVAPGTPALISVRIKDTLPLVPILGFNLKF